MTRFHLALMRRAALLGTDLDEILEGEPLPEPPTRDVEVPDARLDEWEARHREEWYAACPANWYESGKIREIPPVRAVTAWDVLLSAEGSYEVTYVLRLECGHERRWTWSIHNLDVPHVPRRAPCYLCPATPQRLASHHTPPTPAPTTSSPAMSAPHENLPPT